MTNRELLQLIKSHRKAKGLSQMDMANKLNIVLKTYQNIESGVTKLDIDRLRQIAQLVDLNLSSVFIIDEKYRGTVGSFNLEKELYHRLINEKDVYITKLENDIKFYQEMLRESKSF